MGANQSYVNAQPVPVPQGLAVFPGPDGNPHTYVAKQPVQLHVKENWASLSGDSFTVTDVHTGQLWFKMKGKTLTLSQRKELTDATGAPVFGMRHKKLTLHGTIIVFRDGNESAPSITAKQEIAVFQLYKEVKIRAEVLDLISKQTVNVTLRADARGKAGVILLGGENSTHVIAKMYKPSNLANKLIKGTQAYEITIAPGVDTSLIAAMCVIWDEAAHDGNAGTSLASYA